MSPSNDPEQCADGARVEGTHAAMKMRDGRLLARIINLAHRFGCSYTHVDARAQSDGYTATIQLKGSADALRRLNLQLNKLLHDDKQ